MTDRFESILDESISALQAGVPIEDILSEVPEYAVELRPLLYAATLLADPKPELLPEERKVALRTEYLKQAAELPPVSPSFTDKANAVLSVIKRRTTRSAVISDIITISLTVILTLGITALILSFLARDTLPGDLLYGVKRFSETVQLVLATSEERRLQLSDEFNQRRLDEIEQLIEGKRAAVVQYSGRLDAKGENLWIIEGHTIALSEDTSIEGKPEEGDQVEVIGLLRTNNVLVADTIRKLR
jgi:hypothetical protein